MVRAFVVWGVVVGFLVWGLISLGSLVSDLLRLPPKLGLPLAVTIVGWMLILVGSGLAVWVVKYRHPFEMIVSTSSTFVKMLTWEPVSKLERRSEPLVVKGPMKYVRNPLYLSAMIVFFGWGLATSVTSSLLGFLFIMAWFRLVEIPFEEKELRALFGDQYALYAARVPMLIPFTKRKKLNAQP